MSLKSGLIDTPEGKWFLTYSEIMELLAGPYLIPVKWEDGWPILGVDGKAPDTLDLPAQKGLIPHIVNSDDFDRKDNEADLSLVWQWNHNPVNELWSVRDREGYLRLTTGRTDENLLKARNTLTQRTIGPECTGVYIYRYFKMKGDYAGINTVAKDIWSSWGKVY